MNLIKFHKPKHGLDQDNCVGQQAYKTTKKTFLRRQLKLLCKSINPLGLIGYDFV